MACSSALVQGAGALKIRGLALESSEGLILMRQVLMGSDEEEVGRGLEKKQSSVREFE